MLGDKKQEVIYIHTYIYIYIYLYIYNTNLMEFESVEHKSICILLHALLTSFGKH